MDAVIEVIAKVNGFLNDIVWGWPAIVMILATGLLLTIRTKVLQVRKFGESFNGTIVKTIKDSTQKKKKRNKQAISPFAAFASAISGTVGTGNIIGVSSAILTGGPGAVFWMWISAFFGMVTNYAENLLGLYYRKKDPDGSFRGGAFYYIENGVKWKWLKWLAYVAAVFCMVAAIGMSGVQTNKISGTLTTAFSNDDIVVKLAIGIAVAVIVAVIIIGGIKRISTVATLLVPFMSLIFMVLALIAIFMHVTALPNAIAMIFTNAFNFKAAGGGILGFGFASAIRKGMARGVFSNEAGLGSSVIAHSATDNREPVKQGLWGIFEVFFDTFIVCTLTALMLLTTFSVDQLNAFSLTGADSAAAMGTMSNNFGVFGTVCFSVILPLFAFTTILAWAYYGEKATEFLFKDLKGNASKIAVIVFKVIYVLLIVFSAIIESDLVWDISDTANGLMAIPNLIGVILLSGVVVKVTANYYARKKGENVEPMLSAYPEQNAEFIEYEASVAAEEAVEETENA